MFEQILSISKIRNIWGTVTRIYMSISGLKGLRNKLLSASDFFWLAIKTLQWLQLCFLRRPYSMALTRDALVVMYSHPDLTRKITNFLRGTGMKPKNEKTKKVIDTGYDAQSPIRVLTPANRPQLQ